jgi:antitoxin VapB
MANTLPADPETERLAHKVAEAMGKPLPEIVKEAIAAKAESVGVTLQGRRTMSKEERLARMKAITDRFAELPVRDARSPEEIIGYDEFGVPN